MKLETFTAAALAAAALTAAATAADAQPAPATTAAATSSVRAVDHRVGYTVASSADGGAVTTLDGGRFAPAADAASVAVIDAAGTIVDTIPLGLPTSSGLVAVAAAIAEDGRTLTLTPQSTSAPAAQTINEASDTIARKQHNAGVGALIGTGIGAVIGFFLGGVGALVTVPIGAGIGALIGYATP
ncbi:hypothetical protein [Nocardia blacklockiae]|uniref:hypothetical protein n=1 Tax=Nocardia blacklockiae TaxID=480036 RepID=UPI001892DE04|nr:hypothetical protein [Nocardia blacklockiae]MBF6171063.1 hypothetical protein [Nocardia blacklockiae]